MAYLKQSSIGTARNVAKATKRGMIGDVIGKARDSKDVGPTGFEDLRCTYALELHSVEGLRRVHAPDEIVRCRVQEVSVPTTRQRVRHQQGALFEGCQVLRYRDYPMRTHSNVIRSKNSAVSMHQITSSDIVSGGTHVSFVDVVDIIASKCKDDCPVSEAITHYHRKYQNKCCFRGTRRKLLQLARSHPTLRHGERLHRVGQSTRAESFARAAIGRVLSVTAFVRR